MYFLQYWNIEHVIIIVNIIQNIKAVIVPTT